MQKNIFYKFECHLWWDYAFGKDNWDETYYFEDAN